MRKLRFNHPLTQVGSTAVAFALLALGAKPAPALPSFPGAEGFGAVATGGRGGKVIKVTTLAASGPGSLQAALDAPGPRIIVFAVSGVIEGDITVSHGDVTIAGQTAPGGGITIRGRLFGKYDDGVSNIIARFLRVRPQYDGEPGNQFDGMQFSLNSRLMLDHMSISWGVDEVVDLYEADDATIQWSTIEESATSGHPEGQHNYGLINGPDGHRIAIHHNLFAHHKNRNPAVANGPAEIRNNVVYDARHGFIHHNSAAGQFNIVGNSYVRGPSSSTLIPFYFDGGEGGSLAYHLGDNAVDDPGKYVGIVDNPWAQQALHPSFEDLGVSSGVWAANEFDFSSTAGFVPVTTQSAADAYALVLEQAGAFPRDVVTSRIVSEVTARSGSWGVHEPEDFMAGLTPTAPPADGDGDGIADAWESANGLDPANPADANSAMPSGYPAIEEYINELADALSGAIPGGGGGTGSAGGSTGETTSAGSGGGATGGGWAGGEATSAASGGVPVTSAVGAGGSSNEGTGGSSSGSESSGCAAAGRGGAAEASMLAPFALLGLALRWMRRVIPSAPKA